MKHVCVHVCRAAISELAGCTDNGPSNCFTSGQNIQIWSTILLHWIEKANESDCRNFYDFR